MKLFKRIIAAALTIAAAFSLTACSSEVAQIERQAIISAIGIDLGEDGNFEVCAQVFQAMGSGSSTPVDSSQSNTIIASAEGQTVGECMKKLSEILGRKVNTGHNKYIVLGNDALSVPLSQSLDWFIRSEQTYLGVPVICSLTTARDILDVKLKNEVETAFAVENIIKRAEYSGNALKTDLLTVANSRAAALPVIMAQKPPKPEEGTEEEEAKLLFVGTKVVRDGKTVFTATDEETLGFCWLEGKLEQSQLTLSLDGGPTDVLVTLQKRRATIRRTDEGFVMVYKIKARVKLLNSFGSTEENEKVREAAEKRLKSLCEQSFQRLAACPKADFLGVDKIAHSVYPFATLDMSEIISQCGVDVQISCSVDR